MNILSSNILCRIKKKISFFNKYWRWGFIHSFYLSSKHIPKIWFHSLHFLLQPISFTHFLIFFYHLHFIRFKCNLLSSHLILQINRQQGNNHVLLSFLLKILILFLPENFSLFSQHSVKFKILPSSFLLLSKFFYTSSYRAICYLIFIIIL